MLIRQDWAREGLRVLTSIDLFCGAGGLTEGFRQGGFRCLYGNDFNSFAIETFKLNHPAAWAEFRPIEQVEPKTVRRKLGLKKSELSVLSGGPPCQGFSINAPERFLEDPRNVLFRHYLRFLDEFEPQTLVFENVPGMLSLADGHIFERVQKELERRGYHLSARILFAAHYGVPQERWRLIILGSQEAPVPEHPEPTHFAVGRSNFRGGRTMTIRLLPLDEIRLLPRVTVADALGDLPRLDMGGGDEVVRYESAPHYQTVRNPQTSQMEIHPTYALLSPSVSVKMSTAATSCNCSL